jgi:hypothetical protein
MSKKLLIRSFPKTVKGYRIRVPTHHQKEETDIYLLRMISDMFNKSISNTQKGPKNYITSAENHCTHKISIQLKKTLSLKYQHCW